MEDPESGQAGEQAEHGGDDQVCYSDGSTLSRNHGHGVCPPHHEDGVAEIADDGGKDHPVDADVHKHLEAGGIGHVLRNPHCCLCWW